jgi:hypothetical protein
MEDLIMSFLLGTCMTALIMNFAFGIKLASLQTKINDSPFFDKENIKIFLSVCGTSVEMAKQIQETRTKVSDMDALLKHAGIDHRSA